MARKIQATLGEALVNDFNPIDFIIDYEAGVLSEEEVIEGFPATD